MTTNRKLCQGLSNKSMAQIAAVICDNNSLPTLLCQVWKPVALIESSKSCVVRNHPTPDSFNPASKWSSVAETTACTTLAQVDDLEHHTEPHHCMASSASLMPRCSLQEAASLNAITEMVDQYASCHPHARQIHGVGYRCQIELHKHGLKVSADVPESVGGSAMAC